MSLGERLAEHLARLDVLEDGDRVVVAFSGGLDSTVLLHLLRFAEGLPRVGLTAAHLDHAIRPESGDDASWVQGVCRAWRIDIAVERLPEPPANEAEAREARYRFLDRIRRGVEARWVVTAHHADDQAETVLFRVARGTGIGGLRGMAPAARGRRILRPLLPFWRDELEEYAVGARLSHRVDWSNLSARFSRNALRHEIIPALERRVSPGARRALVRLARIARRNERGWMAVVKAAFSEVVEEVTSDRTVVARARFLAKPEEIRVRVIRSILRHRGVVPDAAGTRAMMQFSSSGASGRGIDGPGGVRLERSFDQLVFRWAAAESADTAEARLEIGSHEATEGRARFEAAGRSWEVCWGEEGARADATYRAELDAGRIALPLTVRSWRPGDRLRMPYGSKKVKKLFAEARIPASERDGWPVLVDGLDRLVWVPGLHVAEGYEVRAGSASFTVSITHALED